MDETDRRILAILQEDGKASLSRIGEDVGLTASSVIERVRKLEQAGIIRGYRAILDARALGLDIGAFIGVSMDYPRAIDSFEKEIAPMPEVLEVHHVTGAHSLLIKVRTLNTATLEGLISRIRSIAGVQRTETMVVFSTRTERTQLPLAFDEPASTSPLTARTARSRGADRK